MRQFTLLMLPSVALLVAGPMGSTRPAPLPPAAELKEPAILTDRPLEPGAKDDELRKLLIARRNAALREVQRRWRELGAGLRREPDIEPLGRAARRLLKADLELARKPADQVHICEKYLDLAKRLEEFTRELSRNGLGRSAADVDLARYWRLDAEIRLLRARQKAAVPPGN